MADRRIFLVEAPEDGSEYVRKNGAWAVNTGGSSPSTLSGLSDTTITSVGAGEILKWDGAAWINNTLAEAGIAAASHTHVEADITDLQSYLLNVVEDTTPQLGGNLDVNSNLITGVGNIDFDNGAATASITLTSQADAFIALEADSDNLTETDNPYVLFSQDGAIVEGSVGLGHDNLDARALTFTNAPGNHLAIHNNYASGSIAMGVNGTASFVIDLNNYAKFYNYLMVQNSAGTDYGRFSHDGTDFYLALTNTADWNVTGATGHYRFDTDVYSTGGAFLAKGQLTNPPDSGIIAFLDVWGGTSPRLGAYNWGTAAWQPMYVKGSPLYLDYENTNIARAESTMFSIRSGKTFRILDSLETDYADFSHDGSDFNLDFTNTLDWNITFGITTGDILTNAKTLQLDNANPQLFLNETDQAADSGYWAIQATGGQLKFDAVTDAKSGFTTAFYIERSGASPGAIVTNGKDVRLGWGGDLIIADATNTDTATFSHDGTDFNTALTNTTDWNVSGVPITKFSRGSNANTSVYIGESTTTRGDSQDGVLRIYGENSSVLNYAQFTHSGANLQLTGSGATLFQCFLDLTINSGQYLEIKDSGNTDYARFQHNGTDLNTTFANTTNWNLLSGITLQIFDSTNVNRGTFLHDGTDFRTKFDASTAKWWIGEDGRDLTVEIGGDTTGSETWLQLGKGFDVSSGIQWKRGGTVDSSIYSNVGENMYFTLDDSNTLGSVLEWKWLADAETVEAMTLTQAGVLTTLSYALHQAAAGGAGLYLDTTSSWTSGTLNSPAIRWREADGTDIAGMRGFVNSADDKCWEIGYGWLTSQLYVTPTNMTLRNVTNIVANAPVFIQEQAAANADKTGYGQLWVKNTTPCQLWFTDDAGTDTQIV